MEQFCLDLGESDHAICPPTWFIHRIFISMIGHSAVAKATVDPRRSTRLKLCSGFM